jgi:glycosyltransferase involved in cell wall biosynthesis
MAEGLPVIGTDGGGVREIIVPGENGLLVPMGDTVAMATALEQLLQDPPKAQRLGQAGYQWVRRHFTSGQTARKIERVYRYLLSGKGHIFLP